MNEYTRAEVARHNRMGDVWFIIHKYVYNVTQFIYEVSAVVTGEWRAWLAYPISHTGVDESAIFGVT